MPGAGGGGRFHRARLRAADLPGFRPLTAPLRTALDCGRTMPLLDADVVLDSATHGGGVSLATLRTAADAARGHGAAALRQAVRFVDDLAESPLETVLRLLVVLLGADVAIQVRFRGVGRVDIVLDGWLVIEADGFEFHSTRQQYREDRRRGNLLIERGTVVLRFSFEDVRFRLPGVLAQIERVWRLGPPWRSGAWSPQ
ncbi:endonuclease domain-containing protein [Sporichthya polymorpha]|uniref:endonuclease domain-containing protein n=1 Tax=Sporichthya polymorpha TaxID=35751 RepID=UPI0003A4E6F3|nr:DUF559 domain-containing protein [Sporichthya polymorpha]